MALEPHSAENSLNGRDTAPALITPPKHASRDPLSGLTGWLSCSEGQSGAPGGSRFNLGTPSEVADCQRSSVQLPTPQSPATLSSYLLADSRPYTHNEMFSERRSMLPTEFRVYTTPSPPPPPFRSQQTLTPESSPLPMRYRGGASNLQPVRSTTSAQDPVLMAPAEPTNLGDPILGRRSATPDAPKLLLGEENTLHAGASHADLPCTPPRKSPVSLPQDASILQAGKSNAEAGGKISQIRAQLIENHLMHGQEAEARRPDYLKRTKRTAQELDLATDADGTAGQGSALQAATNIGITDSPVKGRRLTLFQETSDESFEESLMAGGYGRYHSDALRWRQSENESFHVVDTAAEPSVVSEREKKKKSRLTAFLEAPLASSSKTQLVPVEVEGCGRVLINVDVAEPPASPKATPSKGRRSRKKKKGGVDARGDKDGVITPSEAKVDGPNWPDAQFPWGLKVVRMENPEEEERLRHIENFLDRDTDEEEGEEGSPSPVRGSAEEIRGGREKTVCPLDYYSEGKRGVESTTRSVVRSDPADARTALLSKRSVRELSQRLLRRRNAGGDGSGGERVCICNEPDNERDLVQCDGCQIWYHLDCIGIESMSELGREEDPWFCANCAEARTPPPVMLSLSEPTLVPTDDKVNVDAGYYDPLFFQAGLHPSPATPWTSSHRMPRTPPRSHTGPYFSSGSSWDEAASRAGPHTPLFPSSQEVRVYTTPTLESPFDPTSTPSRGIKFGAPFATPKNGLWRSQDLFHTPTRPAGIPFGRQFAPYLSKEDTSTSLTRDFTPVVRNLADSGRVQQSPLAGKRSRQGADARLSTSQDARRS